MAAKLISSITVNLLLLFHLIRSQDDDQGTCSVNEDGSPCDTNENMEIEEDEPIDYLSHIWALPKDYECENERDDRDCRYWADTGACDETPGFMIFNCANSCGYCHLKNPDVRCQRHPEAKAAVGPGDINKMFERLLTDFPEYTPTVLSRDPWLVVLNDVFTDEECAEMIKVGGANFKRSVDAGEMKGDDAQFEEIISDDRTSDNDWCTGDCWSNEIINGMAQKAENITLIPKENINAYVKKDIYCNDTYIHSHDYIFGHLDLPIGPRVYTFFLYLNTPPAGGGTKFNKLGITVPAKKGSVAIWPSVLDEDPFQKEHRTNHEALPVEEGLKYGANMWLHMYNFHSPYKLTCTG